MVRARNFFARVVALLVVVSLATATPITVDDLLRLVVDGIESNTDDAELSRKLESLRPNRPVSDLDIRWLASAGAGAKTIQALRRLSTSDSESASSTFVAYADPPSGEDSGQIWHRAEDYVRAYTAALVDFTCKVDIEPLRKELRKSRPVSDTTFVVTNWTSWQTGKHIEEEVSYYRGREYHSLGSGLQNSVRFVPGTSWTNGEFAQALRITFAPSSRATSSWDHWEQKGNQRLAVYSYSVSREHSQFVISTQIFRSGTWQNAPLIVGYHGYVWIDPASGEVYRLIANTTDIAADYAIRQGNTVLTYEPVAIAGVRHLLLTEADSYIKTAEYQTLFRKTYHDYRKFEAESKLLP